MGQNLDRKVLTISKTKPSTSKPGVQDDETRDAPIIVPNEISRIIVKKRNEKEMNQKELQTKANIPAKLLSDWEMGKGVWNLKVAEKICKVLGIDLKVFQDIIKGASDKKKTTS